MRSNSKHPAFRETSGSRFGMVKTVRRPVPHIPFQKMARAILGGDYELSLVICGDTLARRMNRTYRGKNYFPNVLSFPLQKDAGEIFLNVNKAQREANSSGVPLQERLALLFVHGCLHLKGLPHGRTMDEQERRALRAFGFSCNEKFTRGSTSERTM